MMKEDKGLSFNRLFSPINDLDFLYINIQVGQEFTAGHEFSLRANLNSKNKCFYF